MFSTVLVLFCRPLGAKKKKINKKIMLIIMDEMNIVNPGNL